MFISIESIKGSKPTISIDSSGTELETVEQIAEAYLKLKGLISGRKRKVAKKVVKEVQNVPNL